MIWPFSSKKEPTLPELIIKGERLYVRPPCLSDWPQWSKVRGKNSAYLKPYEPTWPEDCLSQKFFIRRLRVQASDWVRDKTYSFLIFKEKDDALIGGININNVCRGAGQSGTFGYWLAEDEQGSGYMTEALALVIDFGFYELKLHRLSAGCLLHNDRSTKLLERLGFEEEGYAKKYVKIDGKWQDHKLFGLPIELYEASSSK